MKLADSEFGVKLEDVEGLIDRDISFWSIDESGNPGRTAKTLGKLFYKINDKTVNVPDRASKLDVNTQAHEKKSLRTIKANRNSLGRPMIFRRNG